MNPTHCCDAMKRAIAEPESNLVYVSKLCEYGIAIADGGTSYRLVQYCPWCGTKLPPSLRDKWFDELEALGVDPADEQAIPDRYKDGSWYG